MTDTPRVPYLLLDTEVMIANLQAMSKKASKSGCIFRPHFKTHQSREIGDLFRKAGIVGITVSSLSMAKYFAEDGWDDITIAFPVLLNELPAYKDLSKSCRLNILVQSEEVIDELEKRLDFELGVYLELDPDYGRSGVPYSDISLLRKRVDQIRNCKHLRFAGLYCHAGNSYQCNSSKEITSFGINVVDQLKDLKTHLSDCRICYGDTPTCSVLNDLDPIDELSPGNFIFYDLMQVRIGSCKEEDIAVSMVVPIAEKRPGNELIIHGGAVHFSKESIMINGKTIYGKVKGSAASYIRSLSQEHGILHCDDRLYEQVEAGDLLEILPVHSCLTADLMGEYYTSEGQRMGHFREHLRRF